MAKDYTCEDWLARFALCVEYRKNKVESNWELSRQQFETIDPDTIENDDKDIRVNISFPTVKVLLRASYSQDPFIYVKAIQPWNSRSAEILQFLENRLWSMQKRKKTMRRIILDAILLKVGYGLSHIVNNARTGRNDVWLTRVSPYDLWIEPGAVSVEEATYVIRRVKFLREDAKALWPKDVDKLKTYEKDDIGKAASSVLSKYTRNMKGTGDVLDRVEVYEIHDQVHGAICVVSPDVDHFLTKPYKSPYPLQSLFTELIFNEVIDEHYGIGDLEPAYIQQEELDRLRSAMMTHTKRFTRKYVALKGALDKDAKEALESGEDGAVVESEMLEAVLPIQDAPMPVDMWNYAAAVRGDHREITGVNEYMNAGRVEGTKTAYETAQIMSGTQMRLGEKPDLVGDFCEEVAFKDIEIMKSLYPAQEMISWVGLDGKQTWTMIQQWQLAGEHYVQVHAGSTSPVDENAMFQRGLLLYQTFRGDPYINAQSLRDLTLTMMNIREKNTLLNVPPLQLGKDGQPVEPKAPEGNGMAAAMPGGMGNQYTLPGGAPTSGAMSGGINPMSVINGGKS